MSFTGRKSLVIVLALALIALLAIAGYWQRSSALDSGSVTESTPPQDAPADPGGNPSQPGGNPGGPGGNPSQPGGNPGSPGGNPSQPGGNQGSSTTTPPTAAENSEP